MIRVVVLTCDKYSWALKGFAVQFNKYWSSLQPVLVSGYTKPDFDLPSNFEWFSQGADYPKEQWSNGLRDTLQAIDDEHIVIMLEDYWLCRGVNHQCVATLHELCQNIPDVLRLDLTDDRQYNGEMREFEDMPYYGYNDIIWTPADSPYQVSLQAGIWSRRHLLDVTVPDESSWRFETAGTATVVRERGDSLKVLAVRQRPVRYANVFKGGDPDTLDLTFLLEQDIDELKEIGALDK